LTQITLQCPSYKRIAKLNASDLAAQNKSGIKERKALSERAT